MPVANPPVSLSISPDERGLLEAVAGHAGTSLGDFIRRKAVEAAEFELLDRRTVTIPADDWDRFEAWAHAPAKPVPALQALSGTRPVWED